MTMVVAGRPNHHGREVNGIAGPTPMLGGLRVRQVAFRGNSLFEMECFTTGCIPRNGRQD